MVSLRATRPAALILVLAAGVAACGTDDTGAPNAGAATPSSPPPAATEATGQEAGIRIVSPTDAAELIDTADPTVLDVRTAEEFADGHLIGAINIDFNAPDFAEQLSRLDSADNYVLYCRSGNRSGQARATMAQLGFTDVADIEGGVVAWSAAGLPVVAG